VTRYIDQPPYHTPVLGGTNSVQVSALASAACFIHSIPMLLHATAMPPPAVTRVSVTGHHQHADGVQGQRRQMLKLHQQQLGWHNQDSCYFTCCFIVARKATQHAIGCARQNFLFFRI